MPDYSHLDQFLEGIGELDCVESDNMHKSITLDELEDVLKCCKNNKSPGLDGLPYEFYKKVWHIIGIEFRDVLQSQLDQVKLIDSDRVGATRLIPKVNEVPRIDELRPITLLNTDYKILSKVFVKRMKPVLPKVIRSGQLCTVGEKNILFGVSNLLYTIFHVKDRKRRACILSLDFYKAYDRVYIGYLVKVLERMNFSPTFISWIKMLHEGAQTKFILSELTESILVSFSIRQGDPLSMILFILYIEPFLLHLGRTLTGVLVSGVPQVVEAFCDDVNVTTEDLDDLGRVECAVQKFECMSGAILSRNYKCKIMGFGSWRGKRDWPLDFVRTEDEIKLFGIFFQSSYRSMIKRNWDYRFSKFQNSLHAWSSRFLSSLRSRVEVLNTFALSRVFYLASILPINKTMVNKFESALGNFLWKKSGWLLRVALNEVKNMPERGGLGLFCINGLCNSLLLSQFLRLLKSNDTKSIGHVSFWIGDSLTDFLPGTDNGVHPTDIPNYYHNIEYLITMARVDDDFVSNWRLITNKQLYSSCIQSLPSTKVEEKAGISFENAWKRIHGPILDSASRDICYLLVHNKLPVKERQFRVNLIEDPLCSICPGAQINDIDHFFCSCIKVREVWSMIKNTIINMTGRSPPPDCQLLRFLFPKCNSENEFVWLIGNYVGEVWKELHLNEETVLKKEEVFGYLKYKYKADQLGARLQLGNIPGIS